MLETIALYYISSLILQVALIYLYKKVSMKRLKHTIFINLLIIVMPVIQAIMKYYELNAVIPLLTIIYFASLFKVMSNSTKKESINYSIIVWVISILIDILMMGLFSVVNPNPVQNITEPISKALYSINMALILILLANFPIFNRLLSKIHQKMEKLKISTFHLCVIVIIYLSIAVEGIANIDNTLFLIILITFGATLLVGIVIFIFLEYKIINLKICNEILEKNEESNLKAMSQYRIIKHNLNYDLGCVKSVANKKAKILIDELIHKYNTNSYIKYDITSMPIGLNGFVLERLYPYAEDDIKVSIDNKVKHRVLNTLGTKNYALFCEALGVILDNALESTVKTKEKLLYIEFKETKDSLKIKIMNTFSGDIEIDKLGTYEYTSKNTGHGLGLYSLLNRKNLYITTSIKNNLFMNEIEVKKQKNES